MNNRVIRTVKIPALAKLTITGKSGGLANVRVKNLTEAEKKTLITAFDFIETRLGESRIDEEYRRGIDIAMKAAGFLTTDNRNFGAAYTGNAANEMPVVILRRELFNRAKYSADEFAVTILHELMHVIEEPGNAASDSEDEARHDIAAYAFLGLEIPSRHWAFKKYPHILDELKGVSATSE